jgi:Uma2 family endonuclease
MATNPVDPVPVHIGPWTEKDLLALPRDGQRHELVEGSLVVSPPPAGRHQGAASRLLRRLADQAPPSFEVVEALGVRMPGGSVLVPDLLVVEAEPLWTNHSGILDAAAVQLVVEIVSPGSVTMDRLAKPVLYARAGIPAFWQVELEKGPAVSAYRLGEGSYALEGSARSGELLTVARPFSVTLDPADLRPR